jgi:AcrR family transcriptional regulator
MLAQNPSQELTFRAVAREMNIAVGAFSRYFKSLAELKDQIAAKIIGSLRSIDASARKDLREQLLGLCVDWLAITRTYPALATFHGSASTTALAGHVGQVVKVMAAAGIDFERALMTYGMVINLAYSWGMQLSRQTNRNLEKQGMQAFTEQVGELSPQLARLFGESSTTDMYYRSFALLIDGLLLAFGTTSKKR